jgi:tRNA (cmo5U34)-methyltransferase
MENSFTFENFEAFDNHINASIPTLSELDVLVKTLSYDLAQEGTYVVDVGCSTGRVLRGMRHRKNVNYLGIDRDMEIEPSTAVEFRRVDILDTEVPDASVIIAMFTLQFLPPHQRGEVLETLHGALVRGGVLILAEKTHADNPRIDTINQSTLMRHKTKSFTGEEIVTKQMGISPIMHLRTETELFKELDMFDSVSTFWAWGGFRAVIATKD